MNDDYEILESIQQDSENFIREEERVRELDYE